MTPTARGIPAVVVALLLLGALLSASGCSGPGKGRVGAPTTGPLPAPPATSPSLQPVPPTPSPLSVTPTPIDLSRPPQTALPTSPFPVDPIVGTWYAPSPDDLTFEFFPDGTFTESSPNFRTYHGSWRISEEGETDFYDADILDRWGYRKQAHLLYASGTLFTKGIGTMHRVP